MKQRVPGMKAYGFFILCSLILQVIDENGDN